MSVLAKIEKIDVVILCGGKGERLRPLLSDRPKPMAEIGLRPFLDILIGYVSSFGFKRFILCVGYMKRFIKRYYKGRRGIIFSEEKEFLGTGGGIKKAEPLIKSSPFLVMNGDSFISLDLNKFISFHSEKKTNISIVLANSEKTDNYGIVKLGDDERIISFVEKKEEGGLVNAGVYLFEKKTLSLIPANKNYSLEYDFFPHMINKGICGYKTDAKLIDIGTPEGYKRAKEAFKHIRL